MKKKKSLVILVAALFVISLVSYVAFAVEDDGGKSPMDYGLFASENIQMRGSGIDINVDIWANNFLGFDGDGFKSRGNTWSSNDITKVGKVNDPDGVTEWKNDGKVASKSHHITTKKKEMPQMMNTLKELIENDGNVDKINGDKTTFTSQELDSGKSYIVNGKIELTIANGKDLSNNLIAEKNIKINLIKQVITDENGKIDMTNIKPVIVASNGNIDIFGNTLIVGTIYAPNGTVTISGSGCYVLGNIIAKNIRVEGSGLYVNDGEKIKFKEDL